MPNIIHSLDAANIHLLVRELLKTQGKHTLYCIHDCFATTASEMGNLETLVKKVFAEMYFKQNYLLSMHKNFVEQLRSYSGDYALDEDSVGDLQPSREDGESFLGSSNNLAHEANEQSPNLLKTKDSGALEVGSQNKPEEFISINGKTLPIPQLPHFK